MKKIILLLTFFFCCSFTPYSYGEVIITFGNLTFSSSNNTLFENLSGHSFLIIENDYSYPLDLGFVQISPFTEVTVSVFPSSGEKKKGIYFDRESYAFTHNPAPTYESSIYIREVISVGDFNSRIVNANGQHYFELYNDSYNAINFNSAKFAVDIFKTLTNTTLLDNVMYNSNNIFNQIYPIASSYSNISTTQYNFSNPYDFYCYDRTNNKLVIYPKNNN